MTYTSTILIVDDDPAGREALESLLYNQGYRLLIACNGQEALTQAALHSPDLILLDVMMPLMNGFEVCQQLRATSALAEIPVLMVTSLDDRDSRLKGLEAGADDFISKPFDRVELRARVRTITRLNRHRRLVDERTRFAWVVDQADDGFLVLDEHDNIIYANQQARFSLNVPQPPATNGNHTHQTNTDPLTNTTFLALAQQSYHCEPDNVWATWGHQDDHHSDTYQDQPVRYLVRPETPESHAQWLQVDRLDLPSGAESGCLVRLHDITEQMSRKRQMWTFHSLVSHKLGSPMSTLISSLHLVDNDIENLSHTEIKEFISIAFQSAQRLRNQVQEIRNYIRTPSLASTGEGEGYPLMCLSQIIEQIGHELGLDSMTFSEQGTNYDGRLALSRQGIELVFRQLLENAQKFHPTRTPSVEVSIVCEDRQMVCIQVYDDGKNLTSEQLAQAWTPYYQAEKDFCGQVPGMGLGLAMVATLLWNIGGTYRIANREPGPGVMVEMTIPTAQSLELASSS